MEFVSTLDDVGTRAGVVMHKATINVLSPYGVDTIKVKDFSH
jgi:hypothetical protein